MSALPAYGDPNALYVLDLSGFVHRFWHVGPNFAARNFAAMLGKFMESRGPARVALAEDTAWPTFRDEIATDYKANRKRTAAERTSQLEQIRIAGELAEDVHGIRRFWQRGFEGDDVLATLATWGAEEGLRVVAMAMDKDMTQLVSKSTVMWDGKGQPMGPPEVEAKFGVRPDQMVDYLAMVGDTSDHVAGIKGIGPVGAVKVLKYFGTLDAALDEAHAEGPGRGANASFFIGHEKLWAKLVGSRATAKRAKTLVRLRTDVPLSIKSLDELIPC